MAKSNKPIVWGLFAAGGMATALVTPVLTFITLLTALHFTPSLFTYECLHTMASHWIGKLIIFVFVTLSLWHAAHRMRITAHDFGIRSDLLVATILYCVAAIGTILTVFSLLSIN